MPAVAAAGFLKADLVRKKLTNADTAALKDAMTHVMFMVGTSRSFWFKGHALSQVRIDLRELPRYFVSCIHGM